MSWSGKDGDHVTSGTKFGTVRGSARSILVAERVALNFVQRMSGIATATAAMAEKVQVSLSLKTKIAQVVVTTVCLKHNLQCTANAA